MSQFVTRCVRCRQQGCICAEIPRVTTRTRFVIVRHCSERVRVSNTGYFAKLAIPGCELIEYGGRDERFDETRLPRDAWLLFPGGSSAPAETPPASVIVLDGSWSQASHMRQKIRALRSLPLLTLPPPDPARPRLRRPVNSYGMSTLEAIARAVALLEGEERAAALERLHDMVVRARAPWVRGRAVM